MLTKVSKQHCITSTKTSFSLLLVIFSDCEYLHSLLSHPRKLKTNVSQFAVLSGQALPWIQKWKAARFLLLRSSLLRSSSIRKLVKSLADWENGKSAHVKKIRHWMKKNFGGAASSGSMCLLKASRHLVNAAYLRAECMCPKSILVNSSDFETLCTAMEDWIPQNMGTASRWESCKCVEDTLKRTSNCG